MTITGYKKRILAWHAEHGKHISESKASRIALKVAKRDALSKREIDVEHYLRIIYADPTGESAVRNVDSSEHIASTSEAAA